MSTRNTLHLKRLALVPQYIFVVIQNIKGLRNGFKICSHSSDLIIFIQCRCKSLKKQMNVNAQSTRNWWRSASVGSEMHYQHLKFHLRSKNKCFTISNCIVTSQNYILIYLCIVFDC